MADRTFIDGKMFDEFGYEIDRFGRRVLQKMPHILAIIEKNKAEAIQRVKNRKLHPVFKTDADKQQHKDLALLRAKLDSLREDIFHLRCHGRFITEVSNLRTYESWIDEVDDRLQQLLSYKAHLVAMRWNRVEIEKTNNETILRKDHEITKVLDEIDELENKAKAPVEKRDTTSKKARKFVASLDPSIVQQFCAKDGITIEQFTQRIASTWAAANGNGAAK